MKFTPEKILEDYRNGKIKKNTGFDLFISLIENSYNTEIVSKCISGLDKLGIFNDKLFSLLENLLISDENSVIRNLAALTIKNHFINRALPPMKWAIKHETSYQCVITIIKTLEEIGSYRSKKILINKLKSIKKSKFFDRQKQYRNKKYKNVLNVLLKSRKIASFTHKELAEILINYKTISTLKEKFYSVYYELDPNNGLVKELDLSDVQYEVRGWKGEFRNNIGELSEITGLENLNKLKILNLENNEIKNLEKLTSLTLLTKLYISNNKISDTKNLEYLKKMPNLKYLDLSDNEIVENLNPNEFSPEVEIKLKRYLI
jgi:hypothetical protein